MSDAYREASKYETARRRELKRHREAVEREQANHEARMLELRQALSPAAARIVVAAEGAEQEASTVRLAAIEDAADSGYDDASPDPDPGYPPQAWLNQEPAPLPAGALLEVPEKPARRRA